MDKLKKFGKAVLHGRQDYSPVVKKALKRFGDQKIHKIIINRTPLSFFLKAALNLTTLGDFNRRFKKYPHDELFHLRIDVHTPKGVISIEKNEAIFIKARPKTDKKAELRTITDIPSDLTVQGMLDKTQQHMGKKFFPYSAKNNNCSDFIMGILQGNDLGTEEDRNFVNQPVKQLFSTYLRKLSNTVTDLAGSANVIAQGGDIKSNDNVSMDTTQMKKEIIEIIEKHEKFMEGKGLVGSLVSSAVKETAKSKAKGEKAFVEKSKKEQEKELKAVPRELAKVASTGAKSVKDIIKKGKKIFGKGASRKGRFAGRFEKGSQEAKDYMASLREMRGKK